LFGLPCSFSHLNNQFQS
jgi:hypothetical protein